MQPQNNQVTILDDPEFNNLCGHYKDSYEIHLNSIKQRDTLFYALLVLVGVFSLQFTSSDLVNSAISNIINKQLDVSIDKSSDVFGSLLWLLTLGFSSKYFQTVINIDKQYDYLHTLENLLNSRYSGSTAFTREGVSYLKNYALFSDWMHILYTVAFPVILLISINFRFYYDCNVNHDFGIALIIASLCYSAISLSVIFYMGKIHGHIFISKITTP